MRDYKTSAIILAGGIGSRMADDKTKQFIEIFGKTVLERTVEAFDESDLVDEIIVVLRDEEIDLASSILNNVIKNKAFKLTKGGNCRAESAKNGFSMLGNDISFVAIHDAARCLITSEMIDRVIEQAHIHGAATAAAAVYDTLKKVNRDGYIESTVSRDSIFRAQTPQVFSKELYATALSAFDGDLATVTDDNMLVEAIGQDVFILDIGSDNIKITMQSDIALAKQILIRRGEGTVSGIRIGHGYDVHRFVEGRALILGGVNIPHEFGLLGHSDADVLTHAIMDSLLGAAGLGDIGRHFPDTDDKFKGASSIFLLTCVKELLLKSGFKVSNVDATLVMQKPKISPYVDKMVSNIAFALNVSKEQVNVKATTEERLGFTGREEGASAHAVAIIEKIN